MAADNSPTIRVYMHVCMVNHWLDIVQVQLSLMVESGLYDVVESIDVCCVGNSEEYIKLENIQFIYDKIKIIGRSENLLEYEFITLKHMQKDVSNKNCYCLYVHTKGCSYPCNEGGKYWLDYMNYYNITKWEEAVECLDKGYETYGVKLLTERDKPAYSMHYSGNFFWAKSKYINTLVDVDRLNKQNRGAAEMWLCSNKPIAATGCQEFVDYNTKGVFKPFKIKRTI